MNNQLIREMLRRDPFQPFDIVMSDGGRHRVSNPEHVLVTDRWIAVGVRPSDGFPTSRVDVYGPNVTAVEAVRDVKRRRKSA